MNNKVSDNEGTNTKIKNVMKMLGNKEKLWLSYATEDDVIDYIVTSKGHNRDTYYLFMVYSDGTRKQVSKSSNPSDFDKIVYTHREKGKEVHVENQIE